MPRTDCRPNGRRSRRRRGDCAALAGFLAAGFLLGAVSCRRSTDSESVYTASAIVYGQVTQSGTPVAGARVHTEAYRGCDSTLPLGDGSPTFTETDANGMYRQHVMTFVPSTLCVAVTAVRPGMAGDSARVKGSTVAFRPTEAPPWDSVQVNIALP
jgi:hypothetical protein